MKYVTGVNLNVHCARCLTGSYSKQIDNKGAKHIPIVLDEAEAKYFYICGVAYPYKWENNFHLAFRYKEGSELVLNENGISITIMNAERIKIVEMPTYDHWNGHKQSYKTCRNWQFANQIENELKN